MYEFLAPWGVLVPAISAAMIYLTVSEIRRKHMLSLLHAVDGEAVTIDTRFDRVEGNRPDAAIAFFLRHGVPLGLISTLDYASGRVDSFDIRLGGHLVAKCIE